MTSNQSMKPSLTRIGRILTKYEKGSRRKYPDTLELDFKKVVNEVPASLLQPHIALAFRSRATPAVSEIVASWYRTAKKTDRVRLFKLLVKSGAMPAELGPPLSRAATVDLFSPEDIERIVSSAVARDPSVNTVVASLYAQTPKIMFGFDHSVRSEILRNLAGSKSEILESPKGPTGTVPFVEEVVLEDTADEGNAETDQKAGAPVEKSEAVEAAPAPRYASVEIFEERGPWERGEKFGANQVFRENHWCLAEVSVGLKPKGVRPKQPLRPIREPKQSGPVDIVVTAQSTDFRISPRVSKLVLPKTGDSTRQALFRIMPLRRSSSIDDVLRIRFRLFYKFNLLQALTLRGGALPDIPYDEEEQSWKPPALNWGSAVQSDANDFDLMPPRALHIEINPDGQQYEMVFTFKREGTQDELALTAAVSLTADQLAGEIAGSRKALFRIASSETLGKKLKGADPEYEEQLEVLAKQGSKLWSILFDRGEGQEISQVGDFLKNNPLPDGSTIQVSVDDRAGSFVFAWSLLYDRSGPPYTHKGFWGIRYVIEQRLVIPTLQAQAMPTPAEVEIGAMYWRFAQTPEQQKYLSGLLEQAKMVRLALGGPITDAEKAHRCLLSRSSHIVYFYTHGYTRLPDGERYGVTVKDFLDLYNALPKDSSTREAWKYIAEDMQDKQYQSDESWIELTSGRLLLNKLYSDVASFPLRPFVILNMCDSAQVTPTLSESFIEFFLTRGARAVVGTECSIRPVFADFAGRKLLRSLLTAVPIGEALRRIRVEAAEQKNLLGLAYTLFGSSDAVLTPPLLPSMPGGPDSNARADQKNLNATN